MNLALPLGYCIHLVVVDSRVAISTAVHKTRSITAPQKSTLSRMALFPYLINYPPYARIIPRITGSLSLAGSAFIVYHVVRRKKLAKVQHRILLGMSLADMVSSICTILGRIPATRNDAVFPGYGTTGLCTAQGFFYQTILAVLAYNFSLAVYYVLIVRYGWKDFQLKRLELCMHLFSFLVFLGSAVTLVSLQMLNPDYFLCFINSSPPGCESDCDRGNHPTELRWTFFYGPAWSMIGLITAMMILLYWTVRNQESRMDRYRFNTHLADGDDDVVHRERSRRVAVQGLWYTVPFYFTWIFPLTAHALGPTWIGRKGTPLLVLVALFLPLQGLMNALVYARPMLLAWLQNHQLSSSTNGNSNMKAREPTGTTSTSVPDHG